jgi:hypothetical protein
MANASAPDTIIRLNHLALDACDLQVSSRLMAKTQTRHALALALIPSWPRMLAPSAVVASAAVFGCDARPDNAGVALDAGDAPALPELVRAKPPRFVRTNPLPKAEARQRFAAAARAGIDQLNTFRPEYHDGRGTLVGYRRGGAVHEIVVPMFAKAQKGSENERRYRAVAAVMAKFDTAAYE